MPTFDLAKARQIAQQNGLSDADIQKYIASRPDLTVTGAQTPTTQPTQQDNGLAGLLPTAGSVVGGIAGSALDPFLGPLGTIGGSALGGGAGEFLRQLIQGQSPNLGNIGKEAALGGIGGVGGELLGGAFKGARALVGGIGKPAASIASDVAGKAATEAGTATATDTGGNILERLGQSMRKSVLNPKVNPSATSYGEEAKLVQQAKEMGMYGPAEQQRAQSNILYKKYIGDIQNRLGVYNPTVPTGLAKSTVKQAIEGTINYDSSVPTWKRLLNLRSTQVAGLKNNQELLQYKLKLGDQLTNAFNKIDIGQNLTPQEEAGIATWQSIDRIISQTDPTLKDTTLQMSALHKLSPGLAQSARNAGKLPLIGGKIPGAGQVIQGATDYTGNALENIGASNIIKKGLPTAANAIGKTAQQTGVRALFNPQQQSDQAGATSDTTPSIPQNSPLSDFTSTGGSDTKIKQAFALAMLTNPKQAATLKTIYDFGFAPQGTANVGKINAKDYGTINAGLKNVQTLKELYNQDPSLLVKQLVPGKFFSRYFDSVLFDTADTLLRLRTGAQANPSEIKAYMNQIAPSIGDSPKVVSQKLNKLQQDLESYLSAANNATGDFSSGSDTASTLSQFGQ